MREQTESKSHIADVVCTSVHDVSLDDGRTLQPGEAAEGIDVGSAHNAALVEDGHLAVSEHKRTRETAEEKALREKAEAEAAAAAESEKGGSN